MLNKRQKIVLGLAVASIAVSSVMLCKCGGPKSEEAEKNRENRDIVVSSQAAVEGTTIETPPANDITYEIPIYYYLEDEFRKDYDEDIQEELYKQWHDFKGTLPDYMLVLCLWLSESGLDPEAINHNENGTTDYGIPQLNTTTLQDLENQGLYDPDTDDISDYRVQIHLGLEVLSNLCEQCPGGEWDSYRAIQAYVYGPGGLTAREAAGDYGADDEWYEGPDGQWYPGRYGKVKAIERHLILEKTIFE